MQDPNLPPGVTDQELDSQGEELPENDFDDVGDDSDCLNDDE